MNLMQKSFVDVQYLPQTESLTQTPSFVLKVRVPEDENSWMDEYLNREVLESHSDHLFGEFQPIYFVEASQQAQSSQMPEKEVESLNLSPVQPGNKSIFHNYQKHLITLLKKIISISKNELVHVPFGSCAYSLWRVFLNYCVFSKQSLYIIFGIDEKDNEKVLRAMATNIPELHKILRRCEMKVIVQAQELLRRVVHSKASLVERSKLEVECKMKNFAMFYSYFTGFLKELGEGVISRRLCKSKKKNLLQFHKTDLQICCGKAVQP